MRPISLADIRNLHEYKRERWAVHHGDYHATAVLAPEAVEKLRHDLAQV